MDWRKVREPSSRALAPVQLSPRLLGASPGPPHRPGAGALTCGSPAGAGWRPGCPLPAS